MAKKTPDYTKQVRHEKPRRRPSGAPPRSAAPSRPHTRRPPRPEIPAPQKGAASTSYIALAGGAGAWMYAGYVALGSATHKAVAFYFVVAICGVLTNVLIGVLATYALNPRRFPMPRVDKRSLIMLVMILGAVTVFFGLRQAWLSAGLIPPVAVFFFVVRPRLKLIAEAAGTYRPTRRDQALEEIQERRAERLREKEREAAMKRTIKQRLQGRAGRAAEAEGDVAAGAADTDMRASRPAKRPGGKR